jgi:hypothetical protein
MPLCYGTSDAKTITLSFWVKSNKTGTYSISLYKFDGTSYSYVKNYTINTANTWEKKIIIITPTAGSTTFITSSAGQIANDNSHGLDINFILSVGSNHTGGTDDSWSSNLEHYATSSNVNWMDSTSNNFYITGVQLEVGPQSTPFEHEPAGFTLSKCQRYYYRLEGNKSSWMYPIRTNNANGYRRTTIHFPTTMRTTPTATAGIVHGSGTSGVDGGVWIGPDCVGIYVNDISNETDYAYINALAADAEL